MHRFLRVVLVVALSAYGLPARADDSLETIHTSLMDVLDQLFIHSQRHDDQCRADAKVFWKMEYAISFQVGLSCPANGIKGVLVSQAKTYDTSEFLLEVPDCKLTVQSKSPLKIFRRCRFPVKYYGIKGAAVFEQTTIFTPDAGTRLPAADKGI